MGMQPELKRHFGMDWLRIGAFALLIFYHSALYFGPHSWVVHAAKSYDWLALPLNAISPWRLLILFAVSGFASAAMIARSGGIGAFFRERSTRLLVPLFFGMAILVPPQSWARAVVENGYQGSLVQFWLNECFRFGPYHGHTLPHWEHLWFLGYLWAYTGLLVVFVALVPTWRQWLGRFAGVMAQHRRILIWPVLVIAISRLVMVRLGLEMTGMFDDWVGDLHYIPAFLFGLILALFPALWDAVRRNWRGALFIAGLAYLFVTCCSLIYPDKATAPNWAIAIGLAADSVMAWTMLIVTLRLADTVFNRDHPARLTLGRAVFPAYLVHQTVIVLAGLWLLQFNLPGILAYAIIVAAVLAASVAAYQLATRIPWLGPLLGVFRKERPVKGALATV